MNSLLSNLLRGFSMVALLAVLSGSVSSQWIQSCQTYGPQTSAGMPTCLQCNTGFLLSPDLLSCQACPNGCSVCTQPFACSNCQVGKYLTSQMTCESCPVLSTVTAALRATDAQSAWMTTILQVVNAWSALWTARSVTFPPVAWSAKMTSVLKKMNARPSAQPLKRWLLSSLLPLGWYA